MRTVAVAFRIHTFVGTRVSIAPGMFTIDGGFVAVGHGASHCFRTDLGTDRLCGFSRGIVAVGGRVVAKFGVVIAPLSGTISAISLLIAPVCRPVAIVRTAIYVIHDHIPPMGCETHLSMEQRLTSRGMPAPSSAHQPPIRTMPASSQTNTPRPPNATTDASAPQASNRPVAVRPVAEGQPAKLISSRT